MEVLQSKNKQRENEGVHTADLKEGRRTEGVSRISFNKDLDVAGLQLLPPTGRASASERTL